MKILLKYWLSALVLGQVLLSIILLENPCFIDSVLSGIIGFAGATVLLILPVWALKLVFLKKSKRSWSLLLYYYVFLACIICIPAFYRNSYPGVQIGGIIIVGGVAFFIIHLFHNFLERLKTIKPLILALIITVLMNSALILPAHLKIKADDSHPQVVLFGVDGADWEIIEELLAKGELPNFRKAIELGCRANLIPDEPLFSPVLWTTIASGKYPADHGLCGHLTNLNASLINCRRVWDIAEEKGKSAGAVQYLGLYPLGEYPRKFALPSYYEGGIVSRPENYRFIAEIYSQIIQGSLSPGGMVYYCWKSITGGVRLSTIFYAVDSAFQLLKADKQCRREIAGCRFSVFLERIYQDVFLFLIHREKVDLAIYYFPLTDSAGHLFFKYFKPESFNLVEDKKVSLLKSIIPDVYNEADRALGRFTAELGGARFIIISDHGMMPITETVEKSYCRIYNREIDFAVLLGFEGHVDWIQGADKVYLVPAEKSKITYHDIFAAAVSVKTLMDSASIWKVGFRNGYGNYLETLPPLPNRKGYIEIEFHIPDSLPEATEIAFPAGIFRLEEFSHPAQQCFISGAHRGRGIFLAFGPQIKPNTSLGEIRHIDIVPTVLAGLGLPSANDFPGKAADIFNRNYLTSLPPNVDSYDSEPWIPISKPEAAKSEEVSEQMKKQWRALGYIK